MPRIQFKLCLDSQTQHQLSSCKWHYYTFFSSVRNYGAISEITCGTRQGSLYTHHMPRLRQWSMYWFWLHNLSSEVSFLSYVTSRLLFTLIIWSHFKDNNFHTHESMNALTLPGNRKPNIPKYSMSQAFLAEGMLLWGSPVCIQLSDMHC